MSAVLSKVKAELKENEINQQNDDEALKEKE
jgi:hypothetical protein